MIDPSLLGQLLASLNGIPSQSLTTVDAGASSYFSKLESHLWVPPAYRDFACVAREVPSSWWLFGLSGKFGSFAEENAGLQKLVLNNAASGFTFFGILDGEDAVAFRDNDGMAAVYQMDIRTADYAPSLECVAPTFGDWIVNSVVACGENAKQMIGRANELLRSGPVAGTNQQNIGALMSEIALYWGAAGKFAGAEGGVLQWWPKRPSVDSIDRGYSNYWGAADYTPAFPAQWRMCDPRPPEPSNARLLGNHWVKRVVGPNKTVYGTLGDDRALVFDNYSHQFVVAELSSANPISVFESYDGFLRSTIACEIAIYEEKVRALDRRIWESL